MEEGLCKVPLEVKGSFTEEENDFCKMVLVAEERRRQKRERVRRASSSPLRVMLDVRWWGLRAGWRSRMRGGGMEEWQEMCRRAGTGWQQDIQVDLSSYTPLAASLCHRVPVERLGMRWL